MGIQQKPVHVYRGGCLESVHEIDVVVVDSMGKVLFSYGDPNRPTFARSSMKPFQAVPIVESGAVENFSFDAADIALFCASHNGEPFHRSRVLSLLEKVGQGEDSLQCGTHIPRDLESYKKLIRNGKELTPVFSNCSGKHTGMLATCVHLNEETKTYRELDHPHQQRILHVISTICDFNKEAIGIGVDGCGVPVHQLPLKQIATGFARLSSPEKMIDDTYTKALTTIRDSMMAHPEMVAGTNRFDTDLMKAFDGKIVAKAGAEGVQCIGLVESGIGIAIKVEDGNGRATSAAAMKVLKEMNVGDEQEYEILQSYAEPIIKNMAGNVVGKITAEFELEKEVFVK
ncbi:L-asparaginase [Virgibacillus phasianinus]|uniref:L-asparaginase n=1 Tax=Virgibacillus phasianinus TaxID=2017483 RepID=A0A220U2X2_9BACI|nr:asparaginase [Virgibacillus phasianinus]ASK62332.1 L-asparaginase [Virgibacillus phasianinus]